MKLVYDRLAIKRTPMPEKSSGGIIIPEELREKSQSGTVFAMGKCENDQHGNKIRKEVSIGDLVLFPKDTADMKMGVQIEDEGEALLFMRQSDVLAVIY